MATSNASDSWIIFPALLPLLCRWGKHKGFMTDFTNGINCKQEVNFGALTYTRIHLATFFHCRVLSYLPQNSQVILFSSHLRSTLAWWIVCSRPRPDIRGFLDFFRRREPFLDFFQSAMLQPKDHMSKI
ncbi:hypothetical protein BDR07DRAFT_39777 [Suillus spraguei]|nr:hypothetical protein BDR07DRAFT_39777 [Suillus spraguei]